MIRAVITPSSETISFDIPKNYVGKKIEVIVFSIDEGLQALPEKNTMGQFWGVMSNETADDLRKQIEQSRNSC